MSVTKTANGRFKAVAKNKGLYVKSETFDTKAQADAWDRAQKALFHGGIDPKAGKLTVEYWSGEYLAHRRNVVKASTATTDRHMLAKLPATLRRMQVAKLRGVHIQDLFDDLARQGSAKTSLTRLRATLSKFFTWLKNRSVIGLNPARGLEIPPQATPKRQMRPFTEAELNEAAEKWLTLDREMAGVAVFLARAGLRWSEAVELRVKDFEMAPNPVLTISRARSKSFAVDLPKYGIIRKVWLEEPVASYLKHQARGKAPGDLLLPRLRRTSFVERLDYNNTSGGRTIHELRHTYATILITRGTKIDTVAEWMGHQSTSTTSEVYVHWLGADENKRAIALLNEQPREESSGTSQALSSPRNSGN